MASPDGPQAAGRDEGIPHSGARRQPDAGIVRGGRNPLSANPLQSETSHPLPRFQRPESPKPGKDPTGRGFKRGIRSAEEQPEARMSRQDVGERTERARDGESGRSAGRRA